jgi:hypothetical protein
MVEGAITRKQNYRLKPVIRLCHDWILANTVNQPFYDFSGKRLGIIWTRLRVRVGLDGLVHRRIPWKPCRVSTLSWAARKKDAVRKQ